MPRPLVLIGCGRLATEAIRCAEASFEDAVRIGWVPEKRARFVSHIPVDRPRDLIERTVSELERMLNIGEMDDKRGGAQEEPQKADVVCFFDLREGESAWAGPTAARAVARVREILVDFAHALLERPVGDLFDGLDSLSIACWLCVDDWVRGDDDATQALQELLALPRTVSGTTGRDPLHLASRALQRVYVLEDVVAIDAPGYLLSAQAQRDALVGAARIYALTSLREDATPATDRFRPFLWRANHTEPLGGCLVSTGAVPTEHWAAWLWWRRRLALLRTAAGSDGDPVVTAREALTLIGGGDLVGDAGGDVPAQRVLLDVDAVWWTPDLQSEVRRAGTGRDGMLASAVEAVAKAREAIEEAASDDAVVYTCNGALDAVRLWTPTRNLLTWEYGDAYSGALGPNDLLHPVESALRQALVDGTQRLAAAIKGSGVGLAGVAATLHGTWLDRLDRRIDVELRRNEEAAPSRASQQASGKAPPRPADEPPQVCRAGAPPTPTRRLAEALRIVDNALKDETEAFRKMAAVPPFLPPPPHGLRSAHASLCDQVSARPEPATGLALSALAAVVAIVPLAIVATSGHGPDPVAWKVAAVGALAIALGALGLFLMRLRKETRKLRQLIEEFRERASRYLTGRAVPKEELEASVGTVAQNVRSYLTSLGRNAMGLFFAPAVLSLWRRVSFRRQRFELANRAIEVQSSLARVQLQHWVDELSNIVHDGSREPFFYALGRDMAQEDALERVFAQLHAAHPPNEWKWFQEERVFEGLPRRVAFAHIRDSWTHGDWMMPVLAPSLRPGETPPEVVDAVRKDLARMFDATLHKLGVPVRNHEGVSLGDLLIVPQTWGSLRRELEEIAQRGDQQQPDAILPQGNCPGVVHLLTGKVNMPSSGLQWPVKVGGDVDGWGDV